MQLIFCIIVFLQNIEAKARDSLFSCIIKKDLEFFNSTGDGEIVDRLMRSPEQLHTIPSIYLERLISSGGTIVIVFVILLKRMQLRFLAVNDDV